MTITKLHFVKASDVRHDYCFLEISRTENDPPFMDARTTDDRKLIFLIYKNIIDFSLSAEEWSEIYDKANSFFLKELANEEAFNNWGE